MAPQCAIPVCHEAVRDFIKAYDALAERNANAKSKNDTFQPSTFNSNPSERTRQTIVYLKKHWNQANQQAKKHEQGEGGERRPIKSTPEEPTQLLWHQMRPSEELRVHAEGR